jgi:predicted transcriptional regulator
MHATADTSRDAYAVHKANGKLGAQQERIVAFLGERHGAWTRSEIAEATGIKLSAVCGRINEMVASGIVEDTPRRPCRVTGSSAHPVRLVPTQRALF